MYEEKEIKYKKRKIPKIKKKKKKAKFFNTPETTKKKNQFFAKIDFKKIIIRLLILVLVMILIIFIISRVNKNYQNKNKVITDNMNSIVDATFKLYNKDNLPKNIGDSTSLLLEEMLDKELITPLKDKNNKECDLVSSYLIITKIDTNDYRLKIYLSCPSESKIKEIMITCNENECLLNDK